MKNNILIITQVGDTHAYVVLKALEKKGVKATLWHSSDFPAQGYETINYTNNKKNIFIADKMLSMNNPEFNTIWIRRPAITIDEKKLHPADKIYSQYQCTSFRNSIYDIISQDAFVINPRENAIKASSKIIQNKYAIEVGFNTPSTLYSNDPKQIRTFIKNNNGKVVFKPLNALIWETKDLAWINYTSIIHQEDLVENKLLMATPAIYQELIPKAYELRITMMGEHAFGAKILSQQTKQGKLDWRKSYNELNIEYWEVPKKLSALCFEFLQKLGLVFGCFDFIVTPEGKWVFLEVNQMGQFLFLERYMKFPLLDAFTEFLIQGKIDFYWNKNLKTLKYEEVTQESLEFISKTKINHSVYQYEKKKSKNKEKIIG